MSEGIGGMDVNRLISLMGVVIVVMIVVAAAAGIYLFVLPMMNKNQDSGYDSLVSGYDYSSQGKVSSSDSQYLSSGKNSNSEGVSTVETYSGSVRKVEAHLPDDPDYYGPEITSLPPPEQVVGSNLHEIYSETDLMLNYTALSYNVEVPKGPLKITFDVTPDTEYSSELYDTGSAGNPYFNYMYIRVYDLDSGNMVADEGYLRQYSSEAEKEILILREGEFRIDIYGRMVSVDFNIYTGG